MFRARDGKAIGAYLVAVVPMACAMIAATPALAANQTVNTTVFDQFSPANVTVNQGDMVTWNNANGLKHNVHFDDNSYEMPPDPESQAWSVSRTFPATGVFHYYCELHGGPGGVGMSGTVTVNGPPFVRPGNASPMRVPLVAEYGQCTSSNSTHVGPLSYPSCTPAQEVSTLLTTTTTGAGSGFVKMSAIVGNPSTTADEADIGIASSATAVRKSSDGTPYTGKAILNTAIRLTDFGNGASGRDSGTSQDTQLSLPVDCTSGTCSMNTTADTLVPGLIKEQSRTIIQAFSVTMKDAGADGDIGPAMCGPNCGTGDEKVFLREGVFAP